MNTWALTVVGPMVEALIGTVATVAAGVVTSVGAMLCLYVGHRLAPQNDDIVVGGSAAVMGLVGIAATGFARVARRTHDTRRAHQVARGLFTAILGQTLVDLVIPGISIGGHLGGAACGAVVGLLLPLRAGPAPRATDDAA
jgi:membrane associated rhomboid family serine protease